MSKINDLYSNKTEKSIWYKVGFVIVTVVMFFVNIFIIKPKEHIEDNGEFYCMMVVLVAVIGGVFALMIFAIKDDYIHHVYVENTIVDMRTVPSNAEESKFQYKIEGRNEWIDMDSKYDIGTIVITTCSIHRNNIKRRCSFLKGESTLNEKIGRVHASEHGWDFDMLLSGTPPTTAKVE